MDCGIVLSFYFSAFERSDIMRNNKEPKTTFRVYMFSNKTRWLNLLHCLMRNLKFAYESDNPGISWHFQILDAEKYAVSIQGYRWGIKLLDRYIRRHFIPNDVLMPEVRS